MYIISGTTSDRQVRCFVFKSITIARVIADKIERQGFDVEILDKDGEVVLHDPEYDPEDEYRALLGVHIQDLIPKP
jgi:hypothetical protein